MGKAAGSMARVRLGFREKINLLVPWAGKRIMDQVKAVALIVAYLVVFQTMVLGIAIAEAVVIALGIGVIVVGLAFFMEGLFLGLMPLGETIGIKLPQKTKLPVILVFSFILGVGVTFAEPAIGVLQMAGSSVKAWDAPLLFLMLNKMSGVLKIAVGVGVGLAVVLGMIRFMYNISLKWYLYIGVPLSLALSIWAFLEPNMSYLNSVAWDCGGVTTGPVTVPLVLALGIGITRVVSKEDGESGGGGFGVVTLASLLPIFTVIAAGMFFLPSVPAPQSEKDFFAPQNHQKVLGLFENEDALRGYALQHATIASQVSLFGGDEAALGTWIGTLKTDADLRQRVFGAPGIAALERWALENGSDDQRLQVFGSVEAIRAAMIRSATGPKNTLDAPDLLARNSLAAVQAILPLVAFLLLVLFLLLRERLKHPDEIMLGVVFCLVGMLLFNIGIELGLGKLGSQVGSKLPSSFKVVELTDQTATINGFDTGLVQTGVKPDGTKVQFFYANLNGGWLQVPYDQNRYDPATGQFTYVPARGPIFGEGREWAGYALVLLFAFIMGYGATLAEPALNALGTTVENLSAGAFKKNLLMQAVALGVGVGIAVGVLKIIWNVPLLFLIGPPYIILIFLTFLSTEEFVNIGWDSAGVTTGPITVPLVLAMGMGISGQVGAVEGFGILATASVFPILSVLITGMIVERKRKRLNASLPKVSAPAEGGAE